MATKSSFLDENENSDHVEGPSKGVISRRAVIAGFVGTAGALTLAACAPGAAPSTTSASAGAIVRKVTPPRLDTAYLGEHVLCYRPMRKGAPRMNLETLGSQLVAHNYGHGGSGWTLAPGTAKYVVDLVQESDPGKSIAKDDPVTVVGAGVIGLFTAYELIQRGYSNISVLAERFDKLTSHNAGGLLAPVSMDNAPDMQALIDQIGIDAYRFFRMSPKAMLPTLKVAQK